MAACALEQYEGGFQKYYIRRRFESVPHGMCETLESFFWKLAETHRTAARGDVIDRFSFDDLLSGSAGH